MALCICIYSSPSIRDSETKNAFTIGKVKKGSEELEKEQNVKGKKQIV